MFIYAFLILLPAVVFAQGTAQLENELFTALDQNGDGHITKAEAEGYFLSYDTNSDKEITPAEFQAGVDKLDPAFHGKEQALYKLLDRNLDSHVNQADVDAVFALADSNKDGNITKAEYTRLFNLVFLIVG